MPFAAAWMDAEVILLRGEAGQKEHPRGMDFSVGSKLATRVRTYLQSRNGLTDFENDLNRCRRENVGGGGTGLGDRHVPALVQGTDARRDPLQSTGDATQACGREGI